MPPEPRLPMKTSPTLPRFIAPATFMMTALFVRPAVFAQQPPSAVFRPALLDSSAASYSYSTQADLRNGDTPAGKVAVHHAELSFSGRHDFTPGLLLAYGLAYDANVFAASTATPLPDQLAAVSLNLGVIHPGDAKWTTALFLRPGFYGDFENLGGSSFNVPLLASASYTLRPGLAWTFALSYTAFSHYPVLPVLGVRWQSAPDWNIELGFPHTGITWQASKALSLHAGAEFQGGSYRITRDPPAATVPALAGSLLDYREIRAGAGFEYQLGKTRSLAADAGVVTGRKFDYYERSYRLNGEAASYLKISFRSSF
jgi:hypothetical protein